MTQSQQNDTELDEVRFVRQSELIKKILPFSSSTLWRKVNDGMFPAPVKLTEGVTAWRWKDVYEWMQAREEASHG